MMMLIIDHDDAIFSVSSIRISLHHTYQVAVRDNALQRFKLFIRLEFCILYISWNISVSCCDKRRYLDHIFIFLLLLLLFLYVFLLCQLVMMMLTSRLQPWTFRFGHIIWLFCNYSTSKLSSIYCSLCDILRLHYYSVLSWCSFVGVKIRSDTQHHSVERQSAKIFLLIIINMKLLLIFAIWLSLGPILFVYEFKMAQLVASSQPFSDSEKFVIHSIVALCATSNDAVFSYSTNHTHSVYEYIQNYFCGWHKLP